GARPAGAQGGGDKGTWTDPPINLAHIDYGEINRHGEAVGYHRRPSGVDPPGARVRQIVQPPDASGVYRARVALRDPATGGWIEKKGPSTFFPDAMSDDQGVDPGLGAVRDGRPRGAGPFGRGSGPGLSVGGWGPNARGT